MPISKKLDQQLIKNIIARAIERIGGSNPSSVDVEFGRATVDILGKGHSQWGLYKKTSEGIFKSRQEELLEEKKLASLRGAQEAAWARRDDEVGEAEKAEERLSEFRRGVGEKK